MNEWRPTLRGISSFDVGGGAVAAAVTLVASVIYLACLWILLPALELPFSVELYLFGYTGFIFYALVVAPAVGLVVGTAVWRWKMLQVSSPQHGAVAGIVSALGTVLVVPLLFGFLLAARELVGVSPAVFANPVEAFIIIIQGGVVYWSVLIGLILIPLSAVVGWLYQRRASSGSY